MITQAIKQRIKQFKYKYSPTIPTIDYTDKQSRQNWILYMSRKDGKYPVREIYNFMDGHISNMTINTDLQNLEKEGLIRRERDKNNKSFVIPLFGEKEYTVLNDQQKRTQMVLNLGLPSLCVLLFSLLVTIHVVGF